MLGLFKRLACLLCGLIILLPLGGIGFGEQESDLSRRGIPAWAEGNWWIVSSDILTNDLNHPEKKGSKAAAAAPDNRSVFTVEMKFQVEKPLIVDGEICDVIGVRTHKLPKGLVDETNGEPLWRLFIRESDGTLARCEWKLRQWGPSYYVSGDVDQEGARDYKRHLPSVNVIDQLVPLDVPYLQYPLDEIKPLFDSEKFLKYVDEWTAQQRNQTIEVFEDRVLGKSHKVVVSTIWGEDLGYRRQVWVAGYPWWVKWTTMNANGGIAYGIVRARLVEFGNKDGSRTIVREE